MSEIPESDWLKVGFYWMAVAFVAITPPLAASFAGFLARGLFFVTLFIHVVEALYSLTLIRAGANRRQWFWRTLLLGIFSIRRLKALSAATVCAAHGK